MVIDAICEGAFVYENQEIWPSKYIQETSSSCKHLPLGEVRLASIPKHGNGSFQETIVSLSCIVSAKFYGQSAN